MLIEKINTDLNCLFGKTVLITGGGGSIAAEAGRALAYLGANIILAERDEQKGLAAQSYIGSDWKGNAVYYPLDLTSSQSIFKLYGFVTEHYGGVDVIIHNAAVTPFDSVEALPVSSWDTSYLVHLRGPVELTKKFLPCMKRRNSGAIVFIPSAGAVPFMGAYEVFKTAQVELANTLASELENTDIYVFSMGPGFVRTSTATEGIEKVAPRMGITVEEFYAMNKENTATVEEAGTAMAVSLLFAHKYRGSKIGGVQALRDAGIIGSGNHGAQVCKSYSPKNEQLLIQIARTVHEQYEGWNKRKLFERQWMLRDFKKYVGHSANEVVDMLNVYQSTYKCATLEEQHRLSDLLASLRAYYTHQIELSQGFIKDTKTRDDYVVTIKGWLNAIDTLLKAYTISNLLD